VQFIRHWGLPPEQTLAAYFAYVINLLLPDRYSVVEAGLVGEIIFIAAQC
jgi:hypothetical protein